jgi:hypothetical protein
MQILVHNAYLAFNKKNQSELELREGTSYKHIHCPDKREDEHWQQPKEDGRDANSLNRLDSLEYEDWQRPIYNKLILESYVILYVFWLV